MPSVITQLLDTVRVEFGSPVRWGQLPAKGAGIYIISLSPEIDANAGTVEVAPLSLDAIGSWIGQTPAITLDGNPRPTVEDIRDRLVQFWLPDESVLYIGSTADALSSRLRDYYDTPLGAKGPHAGGHWIKTLTNLNELYVYAAECIDPGLAEARLLRNFVCGVSDQTLSKLRDPDRPFPFANLEYPKGNRKNHGIAHSRAKRF